MLVAALDAAGKSTRAVAANDQLTVQFKLMGYCPDDEVKPGDCPKQDSCAKIDNTTPAAPKPGAKPPALAPTVKFELSPPDKLDLSYCKSGAKADGKYYLALLELPDTGRPKLKWDPVEKAYMPQTIKVEFEFSYNDCKLVVPVEMKTKGDGFYTTSADPDPKKRETWAAELSYGLFFRLNPFGPFTDANNPLKATDPKTKCPVLQLKAVRVVEMDSKSLSTPVAVDVSKLKLTYTCQICEPDTPLPKPGSKKKEPKKKEPKKKEPKKKEPKEASLPTKEPMIAPASRPVAPPPRIPPAIALPVFRPISRLDPAVPFLPAASPSPLVPVLPTPAPKP